MTRSETIRSVKKRGAELEPGDGGLRASPATHGFVSSTYEASTSLRRPWKTLTRFVAKWFYLTHDVMKYEVRVFDDMCLCHIYVLISL